MRNVIKWNSLPAIEQEMLNFPKTEWVRSSDHDHIVAELKAQLSYKQKQVNEYWAELEELRNNDPKELMETIAKQAKVIEVLKSCILKEDKRCGIWHDGRKAIEQAETIDRGEALMREALK